MAGRLRIGLLALALAVGGAGQAHAEPRVALVIGNAAYRSLSPLANPRHDAGLMAGALRGLGFEVEVVPDADRRAMGNAVLAFSRRVRSAGPDTVALFYYAGHGVQAGETNYLIPVGAPIEAEGQLEIEAISAGWVLRQMEAAGNGINLLVLDACRNNPFESEFRDASRGLARMDAPSGSLIAYAAAPGQTAQDGAGANSPFAAALAEAMKQPGLKVEEVFKRTRIEVERSTGGQQTPWEESSLRRDFVFAAAPEAAPEPVPAPAPALAPAPVAGGPSEAERAWSAIRDSDDPADFEVFLQRYADSYLAAFAQNRLDKLSAQTQTAALPPRPEPGPDPGPPPSRSAETGEALLGLNREEKRLIQSALNALGHDAGTPDGLFGGQTRTAIMGYQVASGVPETGFLNEQQAKALLSRGRAAGQAGTQVAVGDYPPTPGQVTQPGRTFHDCSVCPEMVVVPAGSFTMGSPESEAQRDDDEGPRHRVTFARAFAVGVHEVTMSEWLDFARDTGFAADGDCTTYEDDYEWKQRDGRSWRNPGFSQGFDHPVTCVSWNDAQSYVEWVAARTGERYRLLSEAEWEYVARAATETSRYWGDSESGQCRYENAADRSAKAHYAQWSKTAACEDGHVHTATVGSFQPNGFGLHDLQGNVSEWVRDCWNPDYGGAPGDGRARTTGDCRNAVVRGAGWNSLPRYLRSAQRFADDKGQRNSALGFRVARDF